MQRWNMIELSTKMKQFVAEVIPAVVGTRRRDGTVQMNPIWYEYRDGYFWLNGWRTSDWMPHVERDGDITLHLLDPQDIGRWSKIGMVPIGSCATVTLPALSTAGVPAGGMTGSPFDLMFGINVHGEQALFDLNASHKGPPDFGAGAR